MGRDAGRCGLRPTRKIASTVTCRLALAIASAGRRHDSPARIRRLAVVGKQPPECRKSIVVEPDGREWTVRYRHRGIWHAGDFQATLTLTAVTTDRVELPPLSTEIVGRVTDPFRLSPQELLLGGLPVGGASDQIVTVTSLRELPFEVRLPEDLPAGLQITPLPRPDLWAPQPLRIEATVSEIGPQTWELPITCVPLVESVEPTHAQLVIRAYGVAARPASDHDRSTTP